MIFPEMGIAVATLASWVSLRGNCDVRLWTWQLPNWEFADRIGSDARAIRNFNDFGTLSAHDGKPGSITMVSSTRNIRMLIDQDCFAFLAEAMCEYSKKTTKFQSLRSTLKHACTTTRTFIPERGDLEQFLAEHPISGRIAVWVEINSDWIADYDAIRRKLAEISGRTVQDKAVIPFVIHLAQTKGDV